jgi:hypothetical protein
MALYAVECLDDALEATRAFLTPVERARWLKLALVTLFVGPAGAGLNGVQFSASADGGGVPIAGPSPLALNGRAWLLVGAVVVVSGAVALAARFVGSVMEFVFVEALRTEGVALRRHWGRRWRQGARLFGFRVLLGTLVLGAVTLVVAVAVLPALSGGGGVSLLLLVVALPGVVVLGVLAGLVHGVTTAFVVPVMVAADCGVLAGWRRLWPTITAEPVEYLAYAVAGVVLSAVGGAAVATAVGVAAAVLLVPFGVVFAVGTGLLAVAGPVGVAVLVVTAVLFSLALVAAVALAGVPVQTYLRYYALLVLGDIEPDFDLVPDQRAAVREDARS